LSAATNRRFGVGVETGIPQCLLRPESPVRSRQAPSHRVNSRSRAGKVGARRAISNRDSRTARDSGRDRRARGRPG
jgi:hypothetical protein